MGIVLSGACMSFAVFGNRYFLFCIGKFAFTFFTIFTYGVVDILFLNADSEQDRVVALNGKIRGSISGNILSVMLGGFISNLFGYSKMITKPIEMSEYLNRKCIFQIDNKEIDLYSIVTKNSKQL